MHFDKDGNLFLTEKAYYPAKHVRLILANYYKGKAFNVISPVYPITREELAFILTHEQDFYNRYIK